MSAGHGDGIDASLNHSEVDVFLIFHQNFQNLRCGHRNDMLDARRFSLALKERSLAASQVVGARHLVAQRFERVCCKLDADVVAVELHIESRFDHGRQRAVGAHCATFSAVADWRGKHPEYPTN